MERRAWKRQWQQHRHRGEYTHGTADLQLRVEPGGKKGDTPKQNDMRARMAAAVVEWQALDPTAKKTWALEARRYGGRMSGYHLFLRERLSTD